MTSKKADHNSSEHKAHTDHKDDKPFKCPECDATYKLATGLGIHRRMAHGILGKSPSTLATRRKAEAQAALKHHSEPKSVTQLSIEAAANISKTSHTKYKKRTGAQSGDFVCPECDMTFRYAKALGKHRSAKHGIPGQGRSSVAARQKLELERQRHGKNGLSTHSAAFEALSPTTSADPTGPASLDPLAYAICIGSVREFCRHFAEEHGFAAKQFTRQFAELFLREARR